MHAHTHWFGVYFGHCNINSLEGKIQTVSHLRDTLITDVLPNPLSDVPGISSTTWVRKQQHEGPLGF